MVPCASTLNIEDEYGWNSLGLEEMAVFTPARIDQNWPIPWLLIHISCFTSLSISNLAKVPQVENKQSHTQASPSLKKVGIWLDLVLQSLALLVAI